MRWHRVASVLCLTMAMGLAVTMSLSAADKKSKSRKPAKSSKAERIFFWSAGRRDPAEVQREADVRQGSRRDV